MKNKIDVTFFVIAVLLVTLGLWLAAVELSKGIEITPTPEPRSLEGVKWSEALDLRLAAAVERAVAEGLPPGALVPYTALMMADVMEAWGVSAEIADAVLWETLYRILQDFESSQKNEENEHNEPNQ